MNLPNKLTMLRIILIPVFMVVLYWGFPGAHYVALAIFIVASFPDMLDGKIARKYTLVTDFGKFADPLADKMLVTAAMPWFVEIDQMPAGAPHIFLFRLVESRTLCLLFGSVRPFFLIVTHWIVFFNIPEQI